MARTLQTALQAGLLVPAPTATPRKSPPSRSKVAKSSAPATARSRVLAVRAIPKVTAVAKPPSIIHPVVRFPVERQRGKASALRALGEQEACFRFASRHSAEAAVLLQRNLDNSPEVLPPSIECCKICRTIACNVLVCPCCIEMGEDETLLSERKAMVSEDYLVRNKFEASVSCDPDASNLFLTR